MQQQRERDSERASNRAKQRERERKKDTERGDRLQAPCASTMVCGFSDRDRVCRMPKIT